VIYSDTASGKMHGRTAEPRKALDAPETGEELVIAE
jgi:hypothetical protein